MVLVLFLGAIGLFFLSEKHKPAFTVLVVFVNVALTLVPAVLAFMGQAQTGMLAMPHFLGNFVVRVDSLSAWFILIINFTVLTGIVFGTEFLKHFSHLKTNLNIHWFSFLLFHSAMIWVCMFENGIAFIIAWELMLVSSLLLAMFEFQKKEKLKAGLNYLIQMHISVVFIMLGFVWLYVKTGSFNFSALASLPVSDQSLWIFVLFFIGFAFKAGFVPLHTWLPGADAAAPSHIAGIMSGVLVKLGIYGIFRIAINLQQDWVLLGELLITISIITAIYGIGNAAVKMNLNRMLAYCTIENIGIIGIGIGLGLIGLGTGNSLMVLLGFGSALLHTLNHSLFKSLLFFVSGTVFLKTQTFNIEKLGGLLKKMPQTAGFFLLGSLAIGALPPFSGFISEYLLYMGLFSGLSAVQGSSQVILLVLTVVGLALVGGISILVFTKTFGVVFLGNPRTKLKQEVAEPAWNRQLPMYAILALMLSVAFVPQFFMNFALGIVNECLPQPVAANSLAISGIIETGVTISKVSAGFIGLVLVFFGIRKFLVRNREIATYHTWSCGYVAPIPKAQYSGRSFVRQFANLLNFMVKEQQKGFVEKTIAYLYPKTFIFTSKYFDIIERYAVRPIISAQRYLLNLFQFVQNGQIQLYMLYGLFFILLILVATGLNYIY